MLSSKDHLRSVTERIGDQILDIEQKLGAGCIAVAHLRILEIAANLQLLADGSHSYAGLLDSLGRYAEAFTRSGRVTLLQCSDLHPARRRSLPTYQYPEDKHQVEQAERAPVPSAQLLDKLRWQREFTYPFQRSPFVVGPNLEWRCYSEPQGMGHSLLGRRKDPLYPMHTQLAEDFGLRVVLAGEIGFCWSPFEEAPKGVVCTTFSGHFQTNEIGGCEIAQLIYELHGWCADTSIVVLTGDDAAVFLANPAPKGEKPWH